MNQNIKIILQLIKIHVYICHSYKKGKKVSIKKKRSKSVIPLNFFGTTSWQANLKRLMKLKKQ